MDTRILEYFLAVSQEENITHAAQTLHLTQPTLSRQMRMLEEELGISLFKRTNHSIELTEQGKIFRRRALIALQSLQKAKDEFSKDKDALTGTITIGAAELKGMQKLAQQMVGFQNRHPEIKYELYTDEPEEVYRSLIEDRIEIALMTENFRSLELEYVETGVMERWGVLLASELAADYPDGISPEQITDLRKLGVIPRSEVPPHYELTRWIGDFNEGNDYTTKYDILSNAVSVARAWGGFVYCLETDIAYKDMTFVPLRPALAFHAVYLWKKSRTFNKATQAFIGHLCTTL